MEQTASPDCQAYVCYYVVLLVGFFVGFSKVNSLLSSSRSRWSFLGTWAVFLAYALVPIVLFWFLDYVNLLRDTSLIAALMVALGYRQILAGQMQGIVLPAQVSKIWSPFETWANEMRDRLAKLSKRRADRFYQSLLGCVSGDPTRLVKLAGLAFALTKDRVALQAELTKVDGQAVPVALGSQQAFDPIKAFDTVKIFLEAIQLENPDDYGFLLQQHGVIAWWRQRARTADGDRWNYPDDHHCLIRGSHFSQTRFISAL